MDTVLKKTGHALEYSILAALIVRALLATQIGPRRVYLYAFGLTFLYALSDELHQSFTPGRKPSPVDVTIDTLGAALGVAVLWALGQRKTGAGT